MSNTKPINSHRLPANQQGAYSELLNQIESIGLTHKTSTGLLDNNLPAEQDRQQVGQLDFVIIGLTKLLAQQEILGSELLEVKATIKRLANIQTTRPGTGTSPGIGTSGTSNIGTSFISYNPPNK